MGRAVAVMLAMGLGACDARSLVPDGGGGGGSSRDGVCEPCGASALLSDFEDLAVATIVQTGSPPRNGYWYTYNDGRETCAQTPRPGSSYVGAPPPVLAPATTGSLALHASWTGCDTWGGGIGADLNVPLTTGGGVYTGPKAPYDLSAYTGVTFWARATPGTDVQLRVKFPMTAETAIVDGGKCEDTASTKCSDNWGEAFTLPENGNWKQITVRFADRVFQQEGWGASFTWNAADVTSIRIQARDKATYDFWIDDLYLIR